MSNLYTTAAMLQVVNSLKRPKTFILDKFFGTVQTEEAEEIHFDVEIGKRRIAPFVSPVSQGKLVERLGFTTNTFSPAYIKPKTPVRPSAALKRAIGENIGVSTLSASERRAAILANILKDHAEQIARRQELMAIEALVSGTVTVTGEGYATKIVNFGRSSDLSIVLASGSKWTDAGANPIDDLEEAAELVHKLEGASVTDFVMDPDAWRVFRKNEQVQKLIDLRRADGAGPLNLGPGDYSAGARFVGTLGTFNIWVYSEFYEDDAGTIHPVLASGTIIGTGPELAGVRAYGAIQDEEAGLQALPLFPKSWVEQDPSHRIVMTQSAPLTVPTRPNASFSMKVF